MRMTAFTKALLVGFLVLLLLIPLQMVRSVIDERQARHREAIAEVSQVWGGTQRLVGPVLVVPFRVSYRDDKDRVHVRVERAEFLPERLEVDGNAVPEVRKRGLFEVVVYRLDLSLSGRMPAPDFGSLGVAPEDVVWEEASLAFGIPDTRGIKEELKLSWDGGETAFRPGPGDGGLFATGIHAPLTGLKAGSAPHPFAFHLTVQGSQSVEVAPVAIETG
ncbi:MAG TPA: inner membrane CreD family protein, partial [Thermoanaerobaculia bacterium]|nr:inner membrane CreD family protein [Thermoanaerobaculia bacterium]